jgi:(S)-3,5-dihydroxyphenylglycine transaminase
VIKTSQPPLAELAISGLHESLSSPIIESMTFLNEVAHYFTDAISFAAGRPYEGFFDVEDVHRYVRTFTDYLRQRLDRDEVAVRRALLQYGRTKGIIHELIAHNLAIDEGIAADPESIVVTVGCQEALYLTLRTLRRTREDSLLAVMPCYVGATGAAQLAEMPVLPVRGGNEGIDLGDLVRVIERARSAGLRPRACYIVPDFANPSGARLSRTTRERLLRLAEEHDLLVLEDNPYGIFHEEGARQPTLKSLDSARRVIYLGSFAKTGMPGARVGFVVADQLVTGGPHGASRLADQLAKVKSMLTVNTSPLAQAIIGGKLLTHGGSLRVANARETQVYRANLRQLLAGLAKRFPRETDPPVTWNAPGGGFFVVLNVPFKADDDLLERCGRNYKVLWTPMHHFYGDGTPRRQIRLSFSHLTPAEIETGLDRLADFIAGQHEAR